MLPPDEHGQDPPVRTRGEEASISVGVLRQQLPPISNDDFAIIRQRLQHMRPTADLHNSFTPSATDRTGTTVFLDVTAAGVAGHDGFCSPGTSGETCGFADDVP